MVLLGEIVTTLKLPPGQPLESRCGACTRCLDVCPTGAFAAPFVLDARRCVAYLTIEHRGPIDASLREGVGEHLFGCDDCQTVCPFNAGERSRIDDDGQGEAFAPLDPWHVLDLAALLTISRDDFEKATVGSPLARAGWEGLARNAAIVLGNGGSNGDSDGDAIPLLAKAAADHPSPMVREASAWAIQHLRDSHEKA